ncbi:fucose isomerase [Acidaminobacter sp. JC074]|uniref:RbsD/FucU family protein n=1 Tax=Acidaminobacter sp. JC074 TaxID=2530199 RepID=UPI001F0DAAD6|nr:RbsD/FucU domain-containing protein [Acidaminobacter sp. JC074]MCH4886574.1 fucose isomerase [Acidaminobacter sp. JC074]
MLKGIPKILSPDLLKVLMEMGHGDNIVIADGNFPSASVHHRVIRADGHNVSSLLEAILKLYPLDTAQVPVILMDNDSEVKPPIWKDYFNILGSYDFTYECVDRFKFYDIAKEAYAVIATSEPALYANIILKKGCC